MVLIFAEGVFGIGSNCIAFPEALRVVGRGSSADGAPATSRVRRGRAAGPVVRVGVRLELLVDVEHAVASTVHGVANLDVVVVPSELLVGLRAREELGATKEVADTSN